MTGSVVPYPMAFLAVSALDQMRRAMADDTFAGIHQLSWFDYSLLIPYFSILVVLSFFGMHRYEVVYRYFKTRRKLKAAPPKRFETLPPVTIQLPLYNEKYVVERLLEEVLKIEYPRELLQIQVLDDSTDETHPFAERLVNAYRSQGYPIEYLHRTNREGYKAGALQAGLKSATGEFVAIFDADFIPPADFLLKTIHHFADDNVGVVQTRWSYLNRSYNLLTEIEALLLDGHFVLEHGARYGSGLFFNFNGTAGILRRRMIDDAGGWQHDTLTEDSDLSYRAQLKGWRFVYVPGVDCPSELPVDMHAFQTQQFRWAKGLTQVAKKLLPGILKTDLPKRVKLEAIAHLAPNISYPAMIVVSMLMLPVMIVRFYMGWMQMLLVDFPLILASTWSIAVFYVLAYRELHPKSWAKSIFFIPVLMSAGVALTISNTRAVLEALLGVQTSFVRTPKYAIAGGQKIKLTNAKYKSRSGWLPYVELVFGTYFLVMIAYAIDSMNYLSLPFLALFVGGYYWAGLATLWADFQGRLAWKRARRLELEAAQS